MVYDIAMDDGRIRVDFYFVHFIYETQLDSLNLSSDKFDIYSAYYHWVDTSAGGLHQ